MEAELEVADCIKRDVGKAEEIINAHMTLDEDHRKCNKICTVEPLLYDHPQNHIGVVV